MHQAGTVVAAIAGRRRASSEKARCTGMKNISAASRLTR